MTEHEKQVLFRALLLLLAEDTHGGDEATSVRAELKRLLAESIARSVS